jgi:hypothetical protein
MYLNFLLSKYDIIFLNEHWILEKDKFILDRLCENHSLLFQPASSHIKGRPSGGLAWIMSKDVKILKYEFISQNLSKLEIEINNCSIVFLGIYAFFNNNSKDNYILQENLYDCCKQIMLSECSQKNLF